MSASAPLIESTVRVFSEHLASSAPAPGGGSAAALVGGLAAALAGMTARLTVGREKYAAHQVEMQNVLSQSDRLRRQLLALVDADAAAYTNLMQAYRLPKGDEARNAGRDSAIQEALRHAVDIPLATAEACVQVLNLAALAVEHGNENAAADAAVGALLAHAAMLGGIHDVRANLRKIDDTEFCVAMEARAAGLIANGEAALKRALG